MRQHLIAFESYFRQGLIDDAVLNYKVIQFDTGN